ncbi:Uncharacterized protein APZ42_018278 [Daphnia magna]|uniref:Uncharacterized protein n=1 Tax=Daphnia magna TaxID=35525 RepID=A0A164Z812_9CRUS|nr:Uncharacterized protein APZ42_018278 [Daphnia magna]
MTDIRANRRIFVDKDLRRNGKTDEYASECQLFNSIHFGICK